MEVKIDATAIKSTGKVTKVSLENPERKKTILGGGAEGEVRRVVTTIEKGTRVKERILVHKKFEHLADIEKHMQKYDALKKLRLPVPETFRKTDDGILMTDLTDNGQNLVLSYNDLNRKKIYHLRQTYPQLFEKYDTIDLTKLSETTINSIQIAAQHGIEFTNIDPWMFVMRPDGTYGFIITDMLNINLNSPHANILNANIREIDTLRMMLEECQQSVDSSRDMLSFYTNNK